MKTIEKIGICAAGFCVATGLEAAGIAYAHPVSGSFTVAELFTTQASILLDAAKGAAIGIIVGVLWGANEARAAFPEIDSPSARLLACLDLILDKMRIATAALAVIGALVAPVAELPAMKNASFGYDHPQDPAKITPIMSRERLTNG